MTSAVSNVKRPLAVICAVLVTTGVIKILRVNFKLNKMAEQVSCSTSSTSRPAENHSDTAMQCTFGVISDIQYADIPDGTNYSRTRRRYYRGALDHLKRAVEEWATVSVDFALDLGDVIDGFGARHNQSERNLNAVLDEYDKLSKPVFFQWGNHEYYNFRRESLLANERFNSVLRNQLPVSSDKTNNVYYHFSPCPGFRIVVLDMYEISMLGRPKTDPYYMRAKDILTSMNPNEELNSSVGMSVEYVRFVKFNGGVSEGQLAWLDNLLNTADKNRERVLVSGHVPVFEPATDAHCLAWNYDSILKVLQSHPSVVAYFCGHDHKGGRAIDKTGIHHVTFPAVVETPAKSEAFGVVRVTPTEMVLQGYGRVHSQIIPFERQF